MTAFFEKMRIIKRYKQSNDPEIQDIVKYLSDHSLSIFNYTYTTEYRDDSIDIHYDSERDLYFSMYNDVRMYISREFRSTDRIKSYIKGLLIEQDPRSPHRYTSDSFKLASDSVIVDAGTAEGIFSLDHINESSHIFMFEPNPYWCEALRYTFMPYSDKVTIIAKAISNYSDARTTKLDDAISNLKIDFLKMDIEGEEYYALQGAKKLLDKSAAVKCAISTYHQEFAYYAIRDVLESWGFHTEHTDGYMWFYERFNDFRAYTLRRGVIRGTK